MTARYTTEELDAAALEDLRVDAEQADEQAANGPYFPERGITAESLRRYAQECRERIEQYRNGGAHAALMRGKP